MPILVSLVVSISSLFLFFTIFYLRNEQKERNDNDCSRIIYLNLDMYMFTEQRFVLLAHALSSLSTDICRTFVERDNKRRKGNDENYKSFSSMISFIYGLTIGWTSISK